MTLSLNTALEFASRGYAVLPATANKQPLTRHGVYSATTNPEVLSLYNWHFAYCAVATGKVSGINVLDIDVRARPIQRSGVGPIEGQGVRLSDAEGVNGFETLEALGGILPDTLAASSPSGGRHYWFKHIKGCRSKDLGPGLQWFSDKKFVLTPPAPGREWLNNLPIAEAPEWLVILAPPHTHTAALPCPTIGQALQHSLRFLSTHRLRAIELARRGRDETEEAGAAGAAGANAEVRQRSKGGLSSNPPVDADGVKPRSAAGH